MGYHCASKTSPASNQKFSPLASNNGHLFSALWIDGVRELAAARGNTGKVERMGRVSREVNRMDADADRMLAYAEADIASKESKHETRLDVEQAEARRRVTRRVEANAYADTQRKRANTKQATVRAEEEVREAVRELRVLRLCLRL